MKIYIAYIKKIFSNPLFYFSVIAIVLLSFFSGTNKMQFTQGIVSYFDVMIHLAAYRKLILIFACIPFTANFCQEWNSKSTNQILIRTNTEHYIMSNIIMCFVTAFITVFLAFIIFLFIALLKYPLFVNVGDYPEYTGAFELVLFNDSPLKYFFYQAFNYSVSLASWSLSGLAISACFTNSFLAICTPLVFSYILEFISIDKTFDLWRLSLSATSISSNAFICTLYIFGVFISLAIIFSLVFRFFARRRIENEII